MSMLNKVELEAALAAGLVKEPLPPGQIQGSSIDLTVGEVFRTGDKDLLAQHSLVLEPGETAVVVTHEELHLPLTLAGVGSSPSSVAANGVLMTNPGHVDPGFEGPLSFTLINMGKESKALERGQKIVTLLFFRIQQTIPYASSPVPLTERPEFKARVAGLARDFLDVKKRAADEASRKLTWLGVIPPIITGLVAVVLAILTAFASDKLASGAEVKALREQNRHLEHQIEELEKRFSHTLEVRDLEAELNQMQVRLQQLEDAP